MPLDEFLPRFDVREIHSTSIGAPPAKVIAAARELTWREVPLFAALMAARTIPALLRGRAGASGGPILGHFERARFVALAERNDELAYGAIGRFWQPTGALRRTAADDFTGFDEPGWAKTAFNFRAEPDGSGGTRLTTETRVHATDAAARRRFSRYWRVIKPGSVAIRLAWLRAIRRRAERG
jgi:hypothetical protein